MMAHSFFALSAGAGVAVVVCLVVLRHRLVKRVELEVAEETIRRDFDDTLEDSFR
jgi:hypothetical protein